MATYVTLTETGIPNKVFHSGLDMTEFGERPLKAHIEKALCRGLCVKSNTGSMLQTFSSLRVYFAFLMLGFWLPRMKGIIARNVRCKQIDQAKFMDLQKPLVSINNAKQIY